MNKTMNVIAKQWTKADDANLPISQRLVACCVIACSLERAHNTASAKLIELFEKEGHIIKTCDDLIKASVEKGIWFADYPSPRAVKIALERGSKSYVTIGQGAKETVQYKKSNQAVLYAVVIALSRACLVLDARVRKANSEAEQYAKDADIALSALAKANTENEVNQYLHFAENIIKQEDTCRIARIYDILDSLAYLYLEDDDDDDDDIVLTFADNQWDDMFDAIDADWYNKRVDDRLRKANDILAWAKTAEYIADEWTREVQAERAWKEYCARQKDISSQKSAILEKKEKALFDIAKALEKATAKATKGELQAIIKEIGNILRSA